MTARQLKASARVHTPVMVDAMLAALAPQDGEAFVDGTFGGGGYAKALLEAAQCQVWGIDRDPDAAARASELASIYPGRLHALEGTFSEMDTLLSDRGVKAVDGVTLDLGVSSFQLEDPARGFSFQSDGPLDMRMGNTGRTAEDVINGEDETELRDVIRTYGEERHASRIARAIVSSRSIDPITSTRQLADIVVRAMPRTSGRKRRQIHPATRTFQAFRVYVNDEVGQLKRGLVAAERLLGPRGRLAVVSFHSLEDREVKQFLRLRSGLRSSQSRHVPPAPDKTPSPSFELLFRGVKRSSDPEVSSNPRARSARLRAAVRTNAPAWCEEQVA